MYFALAFVSNAIIFVVEKCNDYEAEDNSGVYRLEK